MRALTQSRYLRKAGTRQTLAGFETSMYEITARGCVALVFDQINLDQFIKDAEENEILQGLAIFAMCAHVPKITKIDLIRNLIK